MAFKSKLRVPIIKYGGARYEYASTRVRAMSSRLLTEEDYARFMKMDVNEIIKFLEEHEYKKEIDELGMKHEKIELIERALSLNLAHTIDKILLFVPLGSPLVVYGKRYDIMNIKTILRAKESNSKEEDIIKALVPTGTFTLEFLSNLIKETKSKEEVIEKLKDTEYYKILKQNERESQERLEDSLDKFYYTKILEVAGPFPGLRNLVRDEIDIRNILTLLRLKKRNVREVETYFMQGGSLNMNTLNDLAKRTEHEIVESLKKYKFFKYVESGSKEIEKIEHGLRKYLMLRGYKLLRDYTQVFNSVLGYFVAKEREISNIRMLIRSKQTKFPESAIAIKSGLYTLGG